MSLPWGKHFLSLRTPPPGNQRSGSQREIYGLPLLKDFSRWVSNTGFFNFFFQVKRERRRKGEEGTWVRAKLQVTFFCSQQMHRAERPAGGQAATPAQTATASEDVGLNKGHEADSSCEVLARTRPTAKIPIIAASS